jgi:lysophospholipase L1-like esterase
VERLASGLTQYCAGDTVLWIQTDPVTDIFIDSPDPVIVGKYITAQVQEHSGVVGLRDYLIEQIYTKLNALGQQYNVVIQAIGGKHDLNLPLLAKFPYINPLVPSWVKLLVGEKYQHLFPQWTNWDWNISNVQLEHYSPAFADQVIEEMYHAEQCWRMYDDAIFHPDGHHPNRQGHQILFDHLVKTLNL